MKTMVMMVAHMIFFTLDVLFSLPTLKAFPSAKESGETTVFTGYKIESFLQQVTFCTKTEPSLCTSLSITFIRIMRRFMEVYTRRPVLLSLSELNSVVVI